MNDPEGTDPQAISREMVCIATDGTNLYVTDTWNTVRKIAIATGVVTTFAGRTDGRGAIFLNPTGIATDGTNLYVADTGYNRIRQVVIATGVVSTLVGDGSEVGGIGDWPKFNSPTIITIDSGNLYVIDAGISTIRKVLIATRKVTTVASSDVRFNHLAGIASDGANLYVVDNWKSTIRKLDLSTTELTEFAGSSSNVVNGTAALARFSGAQSVTTDGKNLYVCDEGRIRQVVIATGVVTTLSGGYSEGYYACEGITTDGTNIYITETDNSTISQVTIATGAYTRLAGGGLHHPGEGGSRPAAAARPHAGAGRRDGLDEALRAHRDRTRPGAAGGSDSQARARARAARRPRRDGRAA